MIISFLNQKGGAGKSTLARALAVEFVRNKWETHFADMDSTQRTASHWAAKREEEGIQPQFSIATYQNPDTALKAAGIYDLLVVDAGAYADSSTNTIAKKSDLVVIPTGITTDDLRASLELANELAMQGQERNRILFVVMKVPANGDKEAMATRRSIENWGFKAVQGWLSMKTGYGKAMDNGRTIIETPYASLNESADKIIQGICDYALALHQSQQDEKAS